MGIPTLEERGAKKIVGKTSMIKRSYLMNPDPLPYQDILDAGKTIQTPRENKTKTPPQNPVNNIVKDPWEAQPTTKTTKPKLLANIEKNTGTIKQEVETQAVVQIDKLPNIRGSVKKISKSTYSTTIGGHLRKYKVDHPLEQLTLPGLPDNKTHFEPEKRQKQEMETKNLPEAIKPSGKKLKLEPEKKTETKDGNKRCARNTEVTEQQNKIQTGKKTETRNGNKKFTGRNETVRQQYKIRTGKQTETKYGNKRCAGNTATIKQQNKIRTGKQTQTKNENKRLAGSTEIIKQQNKI